MPETADSKAANRSTRFSTVVTVLIALVSTVIALVAAQAAVASGNAAEAQHNGVLAKINLERVDGGTWAQIARNRRAFDAYRFNRSLYSLTFDYIGTAEADGSSPQGTRLRLEAAGQLEESNVAYAFIDSGYLINDDEGQPVSFDEESYKNDRRQSAATYEDIDYNDNFDAASALRTRGLGLNVSLLGWFLALMCFTWAEITKSALRWIWLLAGAVLVLALLAAYLVSGLVSAIG